LAAGYRTVLRSLRHPFLDQWNANREARPAGVLDLAFRTADDRSMSIVRRARKIILREKICLRFQCAMALLRCPSRARRGATEPRL